jgi:hypothetical protein
VRRNAQPGVPLLKVTSGRALTKFYDRTEQARHNTQFGPFSRTNWSSAGFVRILPRRSRSAKSPEVKKGGSLRIATKVHSTGEGPDETLAEPEKTRLRAQAATRRHLYKIKYHCGTPQIHHQAAPSRAQAAGAAVIGRPRGAFQRRVARHSPRHRQQREYGGRACRAGHLREWRPLRIARCFYTTPKTQRHSA